MDTCMQEVRVDDATVVAAGTRVPINHMRRKHPFTTLLDREFQPGA